jgi:putative phosphoribosyl transferase
MYSENISIPKINIKGCLTIPFRSKAIIIFVHGSGSDRFSKRNASISSHFIKQGFSTLLVDLLTEKEKTIDQITHHIRFDIDLLTQRLIFITDWIRNNPLTKDLLIGYFSSSTGTAAAIYASAILQGIGAIVSRGGRTDLVEWRVLDKIVTPILFIIGQKDGLVININKKSFSQLQRATSKELSIIPGASHFFEETGKVEEVSHLALRWFQYILTHERKEFANDYKLKGNPIRSIITKSQVHMKFKDRVTAGHMLSKVLKKYTVPDEDKVSIIGILTGGAVVANIISKNLDLPNYNVVLSKRLRDPYNSENTMGSVFQDGIVYLHPESEILSTEYLNMEINRVKKSITQEIREYGIDTKEYDIKDKNVIIVDDGCYSGSTVIGTCKWVKTFQPSKIILAVPVVSKEIVELLRIFADNVEFILCPRTLRSVEEYYQDFKPVFPNLIRDILKERKMFD